MPQQKNTFGKITRADSVNGLHISEVSLTPRLFLPSHFHQCAQMCVVLQGSYQEEARGIKARLERGSVLLRPAQELHSNELGEDAVQTLLIDFEPDRFAGFEIQKLLNRPCYFRPGILINPFETIDLDSTLSIEGTVLLLLSRATRIIRHTSQPTIPRWLEEAIRIVHIAYREKLHLSAIAAEVNIHPVTLAHAFRHYRGTTVHRTILQLRLEDARRQLCETDAPLSEIAQNLSFADQSHMGKAFKRHFGQSPDRFRRSKTVR